MLIAICHSRFWRMLQKPAVSLLARVLAVLVCVLSVQANSLANIQATVGVSPLSFARNFYGWYTRIARSDTPRPWDTAVRLREAQFEPELVRLLKEDAIAQSRCREIVGIDFDPILNTQDPAERYELGKLVHKKHQYFIDIYAVADGARSKMPDVTAVFVSQGGHYFFVNFLYPNGGDLLSTLKSQRPACTVPRSATER